MSRQFHFLLILLLIFFGQFTFSQTYPVQVLPTIVAPYSSQLSDYANPMAERLKLQLVTTDLLVQNRPVLLHLKIQGNGITAQSSAVLTGISPVYLNGGEILSLSNAELSGYFRFQNLQGITGPQYGETLPDGVYTIGFRVYDFITKKWLSQYGSATIYLLLNDPPLLNLPTNFEQIQSSDFPNITFSWTPRQINAVNVSYDFELKEILNQTTDPVFAFQTAPILYKEEGLHTTTVLYDLSKPALIPGKKYAWRVKAISTSGLSQNNVFKNAGYSQIFTFSYTANCPPPKYLLAEQQSQSVVKIMWQGENGQQKYHLQFRKANQANAQWFDAYTVNSQTQLTNLEPGFTYEYRVGATCEPVQYGAAQSYVYSAIHTFALSKNEKATAYNCGLVPEINISNQQPLGSMVVTETFKAGDFPVKVLSVTGTNGVFSGSGYIQVPYLLDTRIGVVFDKIRINSDYQLVEGMVETVYDPQWGNVDYVNDLVDVNQQQVSVNFPIESITVQNGEIIVKGPNGETETFPGGKDTVITDSKSNIYYVDANGNVSGPHKQAKGGKPSPANTDGVDQNGAVTAITAQGISLSFELHQDSKYAFDKVDYKKALSGEYKQLSGAFVPFKAVANGFEEPFLVKVNISDSKVKADSLIFRTVNGLKIDAHRLPGSNDFVLKLKGRQKFAVEEVQACIKQGDKYKIAGVFNLVHISPKNLKLVLVPTSNKLNLELKIQEIKDVYGKLAINIEIETEAVFDISGHLENGKLPSEDEFGDLSTYSPAQNTVIQSFKSSRKIGEAYYLFVTDVPSGSGQNGYMRLNGQFGFVFDQSARTMAHELGHGALKLEHPFRNFKDRGLSKDSTTALMDYGKGSDFLFTDWKQVNEPGFGFYLFQNQSSGEENELAHLALTPDGNIIDQFFLNGKKITVNILVSKEYTISSIEYNNKNFNWDSTAKAYVDGSEKISTKKIAKTIDDKVNLFRSRGDGCTYDYVIIPWSAQDEKEGKAYQKIAERTKNLKDSDWEFSPLDIRDASCGNVFIKELLSSDLTDCPQTELQAGINRLKQAGTSADGQKVTGAVNSSCMAAIRNLSYSEIEKLIKIICSQTELKELSEVAILRLMNGIKSGNYADFFKYLEANGNKAIRQLVSEMDDASIYFLTDKKNYTNFVGALVSMFNQNPKCISDRWPSSGDGFAGITVNLNPETYTSNTSSYFYQSLTLRHNEGKYDSGSGNISLYDVYTTYDYTSQGNSKNEVDEKIAEVSPLTPIVLVPEKVKIELIEAALDEYNFGRDYFIVPAIFLKYNSDKIRNDYIEKGVLVTLDLATIALSGGVALATKVNWIRRAWAMAEVAGAAGNIVVNTTAVGKNSDLGKALEAYNLAMGIIGVKNVTVGGCKFVTTLPANTKKLLQENKGVRDLLAAKYVEWKTLTTNLGDVGGAEKELLSKQEKVWKSLGIFIDSNALDLTSYLNKLYKSARESAILKFGSEAEDLIYVKFKNDGGAAAEILDTFNKEGLVALQNSNKIQDVASKLMIGKTAYRHLGSNVGYIEKLKSTGTIPSQKDQGTTYFSLNKYDDPIEAIDRMQLNSTNTDAVWRLEFDASQLINNVGFPTGKWNNAEYIEVITRSYPNFGSGGATQFITQSEIKVSKMVNLKTGEVINFK